MLRPPQAYPHYTGTGGGGGGGASGYAAEAQRAKP